MIKNKTGNAWKQAFTVGTAAFAAHAGGGFATGNQMNTFYVGLGWIAVVSVVVAMLILAFTIREGQIMMNSRGLTTYKELFTELFHPFDRLELLFELFFNIMVLMVVASCISGAASALQEYFGMNYYLGTLLVGILILFLTIFGIDLIRKVSSYMGIVILVLSITIYTIGTLNGQNLFDLLRVDFQMQGFEQLPTAIFNALKYASFQWVTVPAILACGSILKSKSDCDKAMSLTFVFNTLGLGLSLLMLLSWKDYYMSQPLGQTLPTLTCLRAFDMDILVVLYGICLFLCLISSAVCVIYGFVARFENVQFLQKIQNIQYRRASVSAFIMILSMVISFAGLSNVVKYGYGYCGLIGIFIILLPLMTVGFYKNRKFIQEKQIQLSLEED